MHGIIDVELAPGKLAELLADAFERVSTVDLMDQAGTGDRAGIDHRVERPVVVGQPDRIERLATRLDADSRRTRSSPTMSSASANTKAFETD